MDMAKGDAFRKKAEDYAWLILGSAVTAAAISFFLVPYKLTPGGVTGVATVLFYLLGEKIPAGAVILLLNLPLFAFGYKLIGRRFIVKTLISTVLMSLLIDVSEPLAGKFVEMLSPEKLADRPDYLLYSIFGGFLMGVGIGLVFKSGATTGGTDLAARILHHYFPGLTISRALLLIDSAVIIFAAIAFRSFLLALYSILALYISTKMIDVIIEGTNFAKSVFIISDHADAIAKDIMNELDRGVTALRGTGMYSRADKTVLYCVLHRSQMQQLKSLVRRIDPAAFVILGDVTEVLGEGFMTHE
jgi:uncharacterized membrane-anchored protein YitT (DUF2179 family)